MRLGDLVGQALLNLQAAREDVDQPRDLAQAEHPALRDVGDVALAEERQQVMLAETVEVDVPDDHHLVIIDAEQRVVQRGVDIGRVAARQELERLLHPLRCIEQSFARRILAQLREQLPDDLLHPRILYRCSRSGGRARAGAGARPPRLRPRRTTIPMRCTRSATTSPARAARSTVWQSRLSRDAAGLRLGLEAGARALLAGRSRRGVRGEADPRRRHRGGEDRGRACDPIGPRAISGWRPTWARSPSRSGCVRASSTAAPSRTRC